MGNCPSGFQVNPAQGLTCVVSCPGEKGFEVSIVDGVPVCSYKHDSSVFVKLTPVQGFQGSLADPNPTITLDSIKEQNPDLYNKYAQAMEQFEKDFPIAFSKIEKQQKINDAFKDLQAAENVRDQSPQAYQEARIRYYTLTKGGSWVDEEKTRITDSEVAPKIIQYMNSYQDMSTRIAQQQQTLDVVNNVKDKVLSMKDEFAYATNAFSKQIDELKNQINIERTRRKRESKSWIDFLLNVLLVVAGIVAVGAIIRRQSRMKRAAYTQRPGYY
jgi:hypothetical protein